MAGHITCEQCEAESRTFDEAVEARARELEAAGYRIVTGGQTGPWDDDGRCSWETVDYRTGEVLASGHGTIEEHRATLDALDAAARWWHEDAIVWEVEADA